MARDYYGLLGVSQGAGDAEIKRAYRKLAREFHPDHNAGKSADTAQFLAIGEAYETLIDAALRGGGRRGSPAPSEPS